MTYFKKHVTDTFLQIKKRNPRNLNRISSGVGSIKLLSVNLRQNRKQLLKLAIFVNFRTF